MENKLSFGAQKGIEQIKIWILAARPKTLTAGMVPILVGTALAKQKIGEIDWFVAILTLICSVSIQIGVNLINDALDFKKGADNEHRIGFKRVTQSGLLAPKYVLTGGFFCFAFATLCGIPLILQGGWLFLLILAFSLSFGYMYTGGPFPLAYNGLGDVFAFVFYGLVATITPYYLQTKTIDPQVWLLGAQVGCFAAAILAVNNFRDIYTDAKVNKRTLAVIWGKAFARWEIMLTSLIPFFLGLSWVYFNHLLAGLMPLLIFPIIYKNIKFIWRHDPNPIYNQILARTALAQLLFGILFTLGYLLE